MSSGGISSSVAPTMTLLEIAREKRDAIESAAGNVISRARRARRRRFGKPKVPRKGDASSRERKPRVSRDEKQERFPEADVAEFHSCARQRAKKKKTTARSRFSASSPHPIDADGPAATGRIPRIFAIGSIARTRGIHVRAYTGKGACNVRVQRTARRTGRPYSPPRHLAANTPKPSHRPYLHPRRSLEAEIPAIFYTREHILHCDVKRSASSRKAQATPASAVSVVGRLVGTSCDGGFSCISDVEGSRSGRSWGRGSERDGDDADCETKTPRSVPRNEARERFFFYLTGEISTMR